MFPLEIWGIIVQHGDARTIMSLRRTSRALEYICEKPFERAWVHERVHYTTLTGLQRLKRDTEHPKFARHIQTVIFDLENWGWKDDAHHRTLVEGAFNNLVRFGKPISIGLRRSTEHSLGVDAAPKRIRGMLHRVIFFADKTGLKIKRLILDLRMDETIPDFVYYHNLLGLRGSWVPNCTQNADSMVRMRRSSDERSFEPVVRWLRASNELQIDGMSKEQLQKALVWLKTIRPCSLSVQDTHAYSTTLQDMIGPIRPQVKMSNITIHEHDNVSWANVIFSLRNTTGLVLCHLENILNFEGRILVDGGDKGFHADGIAEVAQGLQMLAMDASKAGEAQTGFGGDEGV